LPQDLERIADPALLRRPDDLTVACYTFPHYHRSAVNDTLYGRGWTEYVLMRGCRPWFPGHHQPRQPMLGELDEREPATWERYSALAAAHGIDVFIWDWYWYNGTPVLHEALEEGFLRAANSQLLKFAVMWTNHTWTELYPTVHTDGSTAWPQAFPMPDEPAEVWRILTHLITRYCHHDRYWRIDGEPVVVIWDAKPLRDSLGADGTQQLLDDLRSVARRAGHVGIHFHTCFTLDVAAFKETAAMGFDSCGGYNPICHQAFRRPIDEELLDYGIVAADVVTEFWPTNDALTPLPYFPSVSPGWDSAPRYVAPRRETEHDRAVWPGGAIAVDETPAAFAALVRAAFAYLNARPTIPRILTVACWNEWTEGHYLLPDTRLGYGMLKALAEALGISDPTVWVATEPGEAEMRRMSATAGRPSSPTSGSRET
jgi:Glycosyltransferase WbsX